MKGAPLSKADITTDGTPFILYGELYTTYSEVAYEIKRKTDKEVEPQFYSRVGDVIMPTSGETPEDIATATCVMTPDVILAGDLLIYRTTTVDGRIISYAIKNKVNKQIASVAQGKSVVHVRAEELGKVVINYPSKAEQEKIIAMLALLEKKLVLQKQIIETLKKYKRGLVSSILSEKIKISDEPWEECTIGDFLASKSIKQLPTEEAPLMAFTATGGVCDKGERYDRGFLVKDASTKLYKRTDYGDFIYSSNNLDVGSIGLNLYGSAVISDVYEIFSINGADPLFISEVIQQKPIMSDILKYRQGCLYGQYRIYAEDFLSVKIRIPSLPLQSKIGALISQVESKILAEQGLLDNLEKCKAALFQMMFI